MRLRPAGAACIAAALGGSGFARTALAVTGGAVDRTTSHAVSIATGGPSAPVLRCSGTLVSANVVLTARHCISRLSSESRSCEKRFEAPLGRPSDLWVDASSRLAPGTTWKNVASWALPEQAALCGNDIALLVLATPFEQSEALPARVILSETELSSAVNARRFGIAGFGATSGGGADVGTRRSRFDVPVVCVPGAPGFACNGPLSYIDASELTAGAGPCSGDSGAGAIADADRSAVFGVLSRGDGAAQGCTEGVFERTDVWRWLIARTVLRAAETRASAPAWARDAFPDAPREGELCVEAAACGAGSDCVSLDDRRSFVCARRCSSGCGEGEQCESGVCVRSPMREGEHGGGCATAPRGAHRRGPAGALAFVLGAVVLRIVAIQLAALSRLGRLRRRGRQRRRGR